MRIKSRASAVSSYLLAGAIGLAVSGPANAITYFLDVNNITYTSTGTDFVSVTIVEDGNDIKFTVDANESLFSTLPNFGIQEFGFNTNQTLTSANILFPDTDYGDWSTTLPPANTQMNGYGSFDVTVSDGGTQRKDPLMFWIIDIDGDVISDYAMADPTDTNRWFAAHVTDFESGIMGWRDTSEGDVCGPDPDDLDPNCLEVELTSAYFAGGDGLTPPSEIPVPAAVWLFGSGLLGLVGVARRRKS